MKARATRAQMRVRLRQTELMLVKGWRHSKVKATLQYHYRVGPKEAERCITKVYKRWTLESKRTRKRERAAQINRLKYLLEDDIDDKGKPLPPKCTVPERLKVEALLAKICGTEAPVKHAGVSDDEPIRILVEDYRSEPAKGAK